jgi:hypothetical protein
MDASNILDKNMSFLLQSQKQTLSRSVDYKGSFMVDIKQIGA